MITHWKIRAIINNKRYVEITTDDAEIFDSVMKLLESISKNRNNRVSNVVVTTTFDKFN